MNKFNDGLSDKNFAFKKTSMSIHTIGLTILRYPSDKFSSKNKKRWSRAFTYYDKGLYPENVPALKTRIREIQLRIPVKLEKASDVADTEYN